MKEVTIRVYYAPNPGEDVHDMFTYLTAPIREADGVESVSIAVEDDPNTCRWCGRPATAGMSCCEECSELIAYEIAVADEERA